ncbi:MAG: roadblock/LC7 domain-containing protein [Chitinispirillales bacterium]|jgi:predicted regulator of Ras-like GTPase activity (Roadblock/LC7/MglB family)|nr:roadblock/LC7 domain-containing protein [Chitinispirillales bacterium]
MKDMILFPEDIDRLDGILLPLTEKANLLLAILINKDGRLLTNQGQLETVDMVSLAALVAGNSASTLAIAHLVGETEFCTMYHQGKDKHIFISSVDENTFLALVFDDRTNIDRVKVFARQYDRQIKEALVQVYNKSEDQIDLDMDMNSLLFGSNQKAPPQAHMAQQPAGEVVYMDMNGAKLQSAPTQGGQGDPSMILQKKIRESKHT